MTEPGHEVSGAFGLLVYFGSLALALLVVWRLLA